MKKYLFVAICFFFFAIANAQKKKSPVKFSSINSVGLITGQSQSVFTVQTINGVKYKNWFSGLGVSLDNYGYRSIPVFADVRRMFGKKKLQPFVYGDAGINFPYYSTALPKSNSYSANKLYNTFYGETGIGISKSISKGINFILSAGYSYKHFRYSQYQKVNYPGPFQPSTPQLYDFYYRRISIKMGLQF